MDLEIKKRWWNIYPKIYSRELKENDLIGQVLTTKDEAEKIYYSVYGMNARIQFPEKNILKEMDYQAKKGKKIYIRHSKELDTKKILRIIDPENKMIFSENIDYIQLNNLKMGENGLIKIPDASFPVKYEEYAKKYFKKINPKSVIKKTKKIPKDLEFGLFIEGEKIGLFSKIERLDQFNQEFLDGKGTLK